MARPRHIGVVACSTEGAALCYREISLIGGERIGRHAHPEISLHGHSLADYMACIEQDDWNGVAELMLSSAAKLAQVGAEFLICPDNTLHIAFDRVAPRSPVPWLHIAEVAAAEATRRGFRSLGILGTKYTMQGPVYPQKLGAAGLGWRVPDAAQQERINQITFDELVNAKFTDESLHFFQEVIGELKRQGCDAVVLACTEHPLLVKPEDSPLPTLDSTRLLARAAVEYALQP
jgi:aspartate racemase